MNRYLILSMMCFLLGIISMGVGVSQGHGKVYWVLFIPIFEGTGLFSFIGILLIILGIFALMISFAGGTIAWVDFDDQDDEVEHEPYPSKYSRAPYRDRYSRDPRTQGRSRTSEADANYPKHTQRSSIKTGGVIFIGPIPIIWGSDKKTGYIMAVVALIIAVIFAIMVLAWIF